jgi:hypothetical protein
LHELKNNFMQTTKQSTGLLTAASDYVTLVQQAIGKVTGFEQLYNELERATAPPLYSSRRRINNGGQMETGKEQRQIPL